MEGPSHLIDKKTLYYGINLEVSRTTTKKHSNPNHEGPLQEHPNNRLPKVTAHRQRQRLEIVAAEVTLSWNYGEISSRLPERQHQTGQRERNGIIAGMG